MNDLNYTEKNVESIDYFVKMWNVFYIKYFMYILQNP